MLMCSRGFSGKGSHPNEDILIGLYRSNTTNVFSQEWNE